MESIFHARELVPNRNIFPHLSPRTLSDIRLLGKGTIRRMIQEWRYDAKELGRQIKEVETNRQISVGVRNQRKSILIIRKQGIDTKIKTLLELGKGAESKPLIPAARPFDWVKVGDPVICYLAPSIQFNPLRRGFIRGTVNRRKSGGWPIVVSFAEHLHDGDLLDGYGVNFADDFATVMRIEEYKYLIAHLDFARAWARGGSSGNGDLDKDTNQYLDFDQFFQALANAKADI